MNNIEKINYLQKLKNNYSDKLVFLNTRQNKIHNELKITAIMIVATIAFLTFSINYIPLLIMPSTYLDTLIALVNIVYSFLAIRGTIKLIKLSKNDQKQLKSIKEEKNDIKIKLEKIKKEYEKVNEEIKKEDLKKVTSDSSVSRIDAINELKRYKNYILDLNNEPQSTNYKQENQTDNKIKKLKKDN